MLELATLQYTINIVFVSLIALEISRNIIQNLLKFEVSEVQINIFNIYVAQKLWNYPFLSYTKVIYPKRKNNSYLDLKWKFWFLVWKKITEVIFIKHFNCFIVIFTWVKTILTKSRMFMTLWSFSGECQSTSWMMSCFCPTPSLFRVIIITWARFLHTIKSRAVDPVYYSIFNHFWGATNWDVLLTETCYNYHVQKSIKWLKFFVLIKSNGCMHDA